MDTTKMGSVFMIHIKARVAINAGTLCLSNAALRLLRVFLLAFSASRLFPLSNFIYCVVFTGKKLLDSVLVATSVRQSQGSFVEIVYTRGFWTSLLLFFIICFV